MPLPPEKSQLDPLAKVVQKLSSFAFQILFHLDPRIQSFEVITQIESFSSSNRQSPAYLYTLAGRTRITARFSYRKWYRPPHI